MAIYRQTSVVAIRRKFTKTEKVAKSLYDRRAHQPRGDAADETLPLFANALFEYFGFLETQESSQSFARIARQQNQRVN